MLANFFFVYLFNNLNGLSVKTKAGKWEYVTGTELELKPFVEEK